MAAKADFIVQRIQNNLSTKWINKQALKLPDAAIRADALIGNSNLNMLRVEETWLYERHGQNKTNFLKAEVLW